MSKVHSGSLDFKIPLKFTDGTIIYKKLAQEYLTHKKGFFILAPSGAGKTYFIKNQKEKHWIDGDLLWEATHAHPKGAWWLESLEIMDEIDQRSDVITVQAKKLGFWIMGASNFWLKPDAIVLPHWNTHKKYIRTRETTNYDGGATSDRLSQVLEHRKWIRGWIKKGVPAFKSIQEAVNYLSTSLEKENS
jgi:hypothetical protein